jgi:hypothetical protein
LNQYIYDIRIEGHLGDSWSLWFEGMTIQHLPGGETLLTGHLMDQAALHGVLMKIRDLGLPLVMVGRRTTDERDIFSGEQQDEEEHNEGFGYFGQPSQGELASGHPAN